MTMVHHLIIMSFFCKYIGYVLQL